jgi:hypothetical protein
MEQLNISKERYRIIDSVIKNVGRNGSDILKTINIAGKEVTVTDGKRAYIFEHADPKIEGTFKIISAGKTDYGMILSLEKVEGEYPEFKKYFPEPNQNPISILIGKDDAVYSPIAWMIIKIYQLCGAAISDKFLKDIPDGMIKIYGYGNDKPILVVGDTYKAIILPFKI